MFGISLHFTIERWKYNKEYNLYVSTEGRIKSKDKKLIRPLVSNAGYLILPQKYSVDGLSRLIHRVILYTFKGASDLTVDHINSNKRDNRLCNLEYISKEENMQRANEVFDASNYDCEEIQLPQETQVAMKYLSQHNILNPTFVNWIKSNTLRIKNNYFEGKNPEDLTKKMKQVIADVNLNEVIKCLDRNKTKYGFKFSKIKDGRCIARASLNFIPLLK